jgi:hypothetical protein
VTRLKDKPFALIGVHVGGTTAEQLKKITEKNELPWRSFADGGSAGAGPIAKQWNLSATPTLYLIDHKGVIRYKWPGIPGEKVIDAALDELIRAAVGKSSPR